MSAVLKSIENLTQNVTKGFQGLGKVAQTVQDDRWQHDDVTVHEAALDFDLAPAGSKISIRTMEERDLEAASELCVNAFNNFNATVGLQPEFPPREVADVAMLYYSKGVHQSGFVSFVAVDEADQVVGANLLEFRDGVGGIGPISSKEPGAGKLLMMAVMKAAAERNIRSVRLLQVIPNTRSFSLYLGLGFEPRRVNLEYVGRCTAEAPTSIAVKPLVASDVDECSALHERVCGTARAGDIAEAASGPMPTSVARDAQGKIVGYTTGSYLGGHTVAIGAEALQAIVVAQSNAIAGAQAAGAPIPPTTLFVPHQFSGFARWLASNGFHLTRQLTSMSYGPHPEPVGDFYFPSIVY